MKLTVLIESDGDMLDIHAMSRSTVPAEQEDVLDAILSAAVEVGQRVGVSLDSLQAAIAEMWRTD
jgi:hypothetical protein